jgi:hypothetical protein
LSGDCRAALPSNRRERIEAAVVAGGKSATGPHEAWITADPFNGGFRVLITGPHGFEGLWIENTEFGVHGVHF